MVPRRKAHREMAAGERSGSAGEEVNGEIEESCPLA